MANSLTHTPLSGLIKKFLLSIDSYNSSDLAIETPSTLTVDTLGERARLCINFALNEIYDLIKDSRYLEAYPTTALSSIADQDYINLDPETYLDDVESILDTTNKFKLVKKTWQWYRRNFPDPANDTGVPVYYVRRNNRLYLAPRPSSALNYTIDFRKFTGDLELNGDYPLIPTRYDRWVVAEAKVFWFGMEDQTAVPQLIKEERNQTRQIAIDSIMTGYDEILQSGSNTERETLGFLPYERPVNG